MQLYVAFGNMDYKTAFDNGKDCNQDSKCLVCFARGFTAVVLDKRGAMSCGKRYRLLIQERSGVQEVHEGCFLGREVI